jgi:hypothetical protein
MGAAESTSGGGAGDDAPMTDELPGTPSDDAEGVLALGRTPIELVFVSMSERHPEGGEVDYLRWHFFDHRPEQYRLDAIRASLRLISTPECRAARAASDERFDATDHVMNYFFSDASGLDPFVQLGAELFKVGRMPELLPPVARAVYTFDGIAAAPRVKVGADVLPWWPAAGVYFLIERGTAAPTALLDVDGVAGAWWAGAADVSERYSDAVPGDQLTYLFLDDDPVAVANRLRPVLEARWADTGAAGLLAAPFFIADAHHLTDHLP